MIKHVTNAYVFKFVGGDGQPRECHYCKVPWYLGMVCVYSNCDESGETLFVCPPCVQKGCEESVAQWKTIAEKATKPKKCDCGIDSCLLEFHKPDCPHRNNTGAKS